MSLTPRSSPDSTPSSRAPGTPEAAVSVYRAIVERLDAHGVLFERLNALSLSQGALIDSDDTDRLLSVLGERQAAIEELDASGRELEIIRAKWEALLPQMESSWRSDIAARLESITQLAGTIARRDEADRQRLSAARGRVAAELAELSIARRAAGAYAGAAGVAARYQDRQG